MKAFALLVLVLLARQDWKRSWPEALKEAKAQKKLAVLVFTAKGIKDVDRFEKETLTNSDVATALKRHVCCMLDAEGTDEDNRLWQQLGSARPPMTYVFDPEGKLLTSISALNPKYYAPALEAAGPAYLTKIAPAREALARDPNQPDKLAMLGEAYVALDNPAESLGYFTKASAALEHKGDKAGTLRILATQMDKFYEKKWYSQARACCRKILELDPGNDTKLCPMATWVIGMADCADRKWPDAISGLTEGIGKYKDAKYQDRPIRDKMMFTLGSAYMYARDNSNAIRVFEEIILKGSDEDTVNLARTQAEKLRGK
jgi:tetratricopeptide (TPR) repeat protein